MSAERIGADALEALPAAEIFLLGEVHDNPTHHAQQSTAVAAIAPAALVLEMVGPEAAARANAADWEDAAAMEEALGWAGSGWPDFAMYHPVIVAARGAPLYGAEVPGEKLRQAAMGRVESAFPGNPALYGLGEPLPADEQAVREAEQMANHCDALPEELLPGMVVAQRVRDAVLARAALQALEETGGPVAVITGNGHARRDRGIPVYIERARPGTEVLSLGQLEAVPDAPPPYDLWIVTAQPEREDPCAAFR